MLNRGGAVRRLLVMGTKERVGACEELLGYWNGDGRHGDKELKGARL